MKVGIDITGLFWKYRTGVQNYYYGLIEGLSQVDLQDLGVEVVFFDRTDDRAIPPPNELQGHFEYRLACPWPSLPLFEAMNKFPGLGSMTKMWGNNLRWQRKKMADRRGMPGAMMADFDVVQVWNLDLCKGPQQNVIMIHDLIPLIFPQWFDNEYVRATERMLSFAKDDAALVLAVSRFTGDELIRFGVPKDKIQVAHHGVSSRFTPCKDVNEIQRVRRSYKLGDTPFILSVGFIDPRKNLAALIEAYECAADRLSMPFNLVLVGPSLADHSDLNLRLERSKYKKRIIFTGYVPLEDLPILYSSAMAFVYCSLYEGFGMPVLEAMACGTPVIASNTTSLPEVCGSAALMVDPKNPEAIADALIKIQSNEDCKNAMIQNGIQRAKQFTWNACAKYHLDAYLLAEK